MGDTIEIIAGAKLLRAYYKITSCALSFEIKGNDVGVVGLAKDPEQKCGYWFGFGAAQVWIKGPVGLKRKTGDTFVLSNDSFKRFWIAWDSGKLRIVNGFDKTNIISTAGDTSGYNYVTFYTIASNQPSIFRVDLPPSSIASIPKSPTKKIQNGKLQWKNADDALPDGCVIGGFLGECLYIIRGSHASSMTPGYFVPSDGEAFIAWGGEANSVPRFQVLCGYDFAWEETREDRIPTTAFAAGFSEVNNETLYIGRVKHGGGHIPGKVQPSHRVCYIAYENKEVAFKEYEILVVPNSNLYSVNSYFKPPSIPFIDNANHFVNMMNPQPHINDEINEDEASDYDSDLDNEYRNAF